MWSASFRFIWRKMEMAICGLCSTGSNKLHDFNVDVGVVLLCRKEMFDKMEVIGQVRVLRESVV